jgi:hypothetical protein
MQQFARALLILLFVASSLFSQSPKSSQAETDQVFDFQLPWDDSSSTVTDLSYLNHKPAGRYGFLTVGEDGHLYTGSRRIKFVGVNVTYISALPEHDIAVKVARRLAKFGVNIVRFHLIDADWGTPSIFDPAFTGTRHLDPDALDRLDYFVAQLKANGIYTNMNLLAGRRFSAHDGLDASIDSLGWKESQTPAMLDPKMIDLQKEYATQLLDRVNPYTGLRYTEDPAVAFVEVINEHGLLHAWLSGLMDTLPQYYFEQLRTDWNTHLTGLYGSHAKLEESWAISEPTGDELLRNGDFSSGLTYWNVERHQGAAATADVVTEADKRAARIRVTTTSAQNWHIQLNQGNLPVAKEKVYTLDFWAKADRSKTINVAIEQAHDPWQSLGFQKNLPLTTSWQRFQISLVLTGSDTNARLNFRNMADQLATYYFADLSLRPGGTLGVFPEEDLDTASMRLFKYDEAGERTDAAKQDWTRYLWNREEFYFRTLRDHAQGTLTAKALMMGTIVGTSTPNLMNLFDVIDAHSYWQHPAWEGESYNSPWWIWNSSLAGVEDGGTISGLAMRRVHGKPFSVSEYNHPFPNSFGSEAYLFLFTYGALQDWDALYPYTYSDGTLSWSEDRQNGYFDFQHDPGKMTSLVQASHIFRRSDVSPAQQLATVEMTIEDEIRLIPTVSSWRLVDAEHVEMPLSAGLLHRTALISIPGDNNFLSDTGEVRWNTTAGILEVNTDKTKGILGYVQGKTFDLGGFILRPVSSLQDWMGVFLSEAGGSTPHPEIKKYLLSAHGLVQNSGMTWRHYPSGLPAGFPPPAEVQLNLSDWGTGPVQVEGVSCEVTLPFAASQVEVFSLNNTGARKSSVPVTNTSGSAKFEISAVYQTLWYEISIQQPISKRWLPGLTFDGNSFLGVAVSNPSGQSASVSLAALSTDGTTSLFPNNPAGGSVGPGTQFADLAQEIFGTPSSLPVEGWLEIVTDTPSVGVFAQSGAANLAWLDGASAQSDHHKKLYFQRIYEGEGSFRQMDSETTLHIVNPHESAVSVRLDFIAPSTSQTQNTVLLAQVTRPIVARGALIATVEELFGTTGTGYAVAEVQEGEGIVGYSTVRLLDAQTMFALNAAAPGGSAAQFSAQLASVANLLFTNIKLINTSESSSTVRLTAVSEEGGLLAPTQELTLGPGESVEEDAAEMFAFNDEVGMELADRAVGSLKVETLKGYGVVGDVVFGLNNNGYAAALPLQSQAFKRAVFSHVADIPGLFFTGIALFNPGSSTASITVEVLSREGISKGKQSVDLLPGHRLDEVLSQFIPEAQGQPDGYILLTSSEPIIAQELFGSVALTLLSAVPPFVLE